MRDALILAVSMRVLRSLRARRMTVVTAESCTGGMVSASLTDHAGSSEVVFGGFVTYSDAMKSRLLGIPADLLERCGAVSREVVFAMAQGALAGSGADLAVAVTGIAGPGGGSAGKPVGLVWLCAADATGESRVERQIFAGDRSAIRARTTIRALELLEDLAGLHA